MQNLSFEYVKKYCISEQVVVYNTTCISL